MVFDFVQRARVSQTYESSATARPILFFPLPEYVGTMSNMSFTFDASVVVNTTGSVEMPSVLRIPLERC